MRLRFLCQESISPILNLATDRFFLQAVEAGDAGCLRIYSFPGDVILLGHYHAVDELTGSQDVTLARRLSGGRVVPAGQGFVQFALILPHRSALFSEDPYQLAPFQVLNRYMRPVLQGLKAGGVEVFYPGRDLLTVRQRPLGWVSFTTADDGALLCEGGLAVNRDFSVLPYFLDRADPRGTIVSQFFAPEQVTSVERCLRAPISFAQVVQLLRRGFAQQPGVEIVEQGISPAEQTAITLLAERQTDLPRIQDRPVRWDLPLQATTATQLGVLHVRFSLTAEKAVADMQFSGDLIADPAAIDALEQGLRGCPLERETLWQVVDRLFLQPQHYLLGVGRLETIVEALLKAERQS
jgi:lipoate-protein ligase A